MGTLVAEHLPVAMLALLLTACGGAQATPAGKPAPQTPRALYPMAVGNAWSYDVDTGDGESVLAVFRVLALEGNIAEVEVTGVQDVQRYELRPKGIFRVAKGAFLLRAPIVVGATWSSGGGMTARVVATDRRISGSAGQFERCVEVLEQGAASGSRITTTYCPGVGPALVELVLDLPTRPVRVVSRLRGYRTEPTP